MKHKKRLIAFILGFSLLGSGIAFAASEAMPERYVPIMPEFLEVGNGVTIKCPLYMEDLKVKDYFSDFYDKPYLVVLQQLAYTNYYPEGTQNKKFVGDDKLWNVLFLKPKKKDNFNYEFTYFDPRKNEFNSPMPMRIATNNYNSFDVLGYHYDVKNKKFYAPNFYDYDKVNFSYVIDSNVLSKPVQAYPYYSCLKGIDFTVNSFDLGKPCHYNWWIGKKRIDESDNDGIIKPVPKDDTSSDGTSSDGTSSGDTSSGGKNENYPKPGIGGHGDVKPGDSNGNIDNSKSGGFRVQYFYIDDDGKEHVFAYKNVFHDDYYDGFNLSLYDTKTLNFDEWNGYVPEYKTYKYKATDTMNRIVQIYFKKKKPSSISTLPKPLYGGDGDLKEDKGSIDNTKNATINIHHYIVNDGKKTPAKLSGGGSIRQLTSTANTVVSWNPLKVDGYVSEYVKYRFEMVDNRNVEVLYYPTGTKVNNNTGGTSSGGDTSSGGTSSGGDTSSSDDFFPKPPKPIPEGIDLPINPFNPYSYKDNDFKPNNDNPFNFDLFEGIDKPKPLEFPDSLNIPSATEPHMSIPSATEPHMNIPSATEPKMTIPEVDDPFANWGY